MEIVTISKEEFDNFAENHKYRNYHQTSKYGNIMSNFNYEVRYIGVKNNKALIGASLLLIQNSVMNTKLAYAPRGLLFDFSDSKAVEELVSALRNSLGKEGIVSLKIDPSIPLTIRDKNGNIMNVNNEGKIIVENLLNAGFTHKGENLYFETEKPRWEAITVLEKDIRDIYQGFDQKTRIKINKAIKNSVEVTRDTKRDVNTLYSYIKKSGYPLKYYTGICNNFKDKVDIFYAKLNTEKFLENIKLNYDKELNNNENLTAQFQDLAQRNENRRELFDKKVVSDKNLNIYKNNLIFATNLLKEHPQGLTIAGALSIIYDNAAYLIAEGVDPKFKGLNAHYLLKWQMINEYNNEHLKYINLNAVTGDFSEHSKYKALNEIKCSYNAVITEYIGEFDIILNKFKHGIYQKFSK